MTEYIYYTGIGAKKSGKHTIDEFLKIVKSDSGLLGGICDADRLKKRKVYDKCINKYTKSGNIKECKKDVYYKKHDECIEKNFKNLKHLKSSNNVIITTESDRNSKEYKEYIKKCGKLLDNGHKNMYNCNTKYYDNPKVKECKELKNNTTAKCSLNKIIEYVGAEKIKNKK